MKQRANPKCATIALGKPAPMRPVQIFLSVIRRYPILIGAFLLTIRSVSAGLDELDETGASGSSSEADSGQRVRELGRPLYRTFTRKTKES